jgi:hypothetical protein
VLVKQSASTEAAGPGAGMLAAFLVGIPALIGALATGAPTYIFNRNDWDRFGFALQHNKKIIILFFHNSLLN